MQSLAKAFVLQFLVDRERLAVAESLTFVAPTNDYYDFVAHNRTSTGGAVHRRPSGLKKHYDLVFGPVAMGLQRLVIHDCDQVSFHDQSLASQVLTAPLVCEYATDNDGLLR
jgi:hypothetical protein